MTKRYWLQIHAVRILSLVPSAVLFPLGFSIRHYEAGAALLIASGVFFLFSLILWHIGDWRD
jgi:hypothetical protein